jgi:hypothetical protein
VFHIIFPYCKEFQPLSISLRVACFRF